MRSIHANVSDHYQSEKPGLMDKRVSVDVLKSSSVRNVDLE